MKKTVFIPLFFILIITGCNPQGEWKDDQINKKVKSTIHQLNDLVIESLANNKPDQILLLSSTRFMEKYSYEFDESVKQASEEFSNNKFVILHEYYNKSSEDNSLINTSFSISGDDDFLIGFKALTKESYVIIGYLDNKIKQTMMAIVYGKYDSQWRINTMQFGIYKIMGKNAYEWYMKAKDDVDKKYYINAASDMSFSLKSLKPANTLWKYIKEEEIYNYGLQLDSIIKSAVKIPFTINEIKTHPEIFKISSFGLKEGYYPMIEYVTPINLSDTLKLSNEVDQIHSVIKEVFSGISQEYDMVIYNAYNNKPTAISHYNSHIFSRRFEIKKD